MSTTRKKIIFFEKLPSQDAHSLKGRLVMEDRSELTFFYDGDPFAKPQLQTHIVGIGGPEKDELYATGNLTDPKLKSFQIHGTEGAIAKFNTIVRY